MHLTLKGNHKQGKQIDYSLQENTNVGIKEQLDLNKELGIMDSLRNIFQLGGGNGQPGRELPNLTRRTLITEDAHSWELVNNGDDQSAPNIVGWFSQQGGGECNLNSRELIHTSH